MLGGMTCKLHGYSDFEGLVPFDLPDLPCCPSQRGMQEAVCHELEDVLQWVCIIVTKGAAYRHQGVIIADRQWDGRNGYLAVKFDPVEATRHVNVTHLLFYDHRNRLLAAKPQGIELLAGDSFKIDYTIRFFLTNDSRLHPQPYRHV